MNEYVTFVGVNIGKYSLSIANGYKHKSVGVIAIEAHPETYRALCKNIECNYLKT
jgi:tRNA G37 N-methylase Trm5